MAILRHVQSSGKKEVTGAHVLVAIFGEKDSHAAYFLQQQGVKRLDVVTYVAHGVQPASVPPPALCAALRATPLRTLVATSVARAIEILPALEAHRLIGASNHGRLGRMSADILLICLLNSA